MRGYIYILSGMIGRSKKRIYYIGSTKKDPEIRLTEHIEGKSKFTSKMRDIRLEYYMYITSGSLFAVENHLKRYRRIAYILVGKKGYNFPNRELRFWEWCKKCGIYVKKTWKRLNSHGIASVSTEMVR